MVLAEVCEMIIDCEHKTASTQETGYPSIRTPNIGRGYFILDGVNRVSEETYKYWTRRAIPMPGDLIMAREAPVGNVAMIPEGLQPCLGQRTVLIRCNTRKVDPRYLVYLLISPDMQSKINGLATGATVPHLNVDDIRKLRLPELPPINLQREISDILSAYDDLIENNNRRIKILEEIARTIYREWFIEFRFPGHEGERLVETELGLLPETWRVVPLSEVTSYINRGVSPKYCEMSAFLVINQKCIRNNKLNLGLARYHTSTYSKEKEVQFGDVLINSTGIGTLGRVAQVHQELKNYTVDSHVTITRPNGLVDIEYFGFYLIGLERYFDHMGVGATGQTELSRETVANTKFILPLKDLQSKFGNIVTPITRLIQNLQGRNLLLQKSRDLLLPRLINGEVDALAFELGKEPSE